MSHYIASQSTHFQREVMQQVTIILATVLLTRAPFALGHVSAIVENVQNFNGLFTNVFQCTPNAAMQKFQMIKI